jgi:hypothetical protein
MMTFKYWVIESASSVVLFLSLNAAIKTEKAKGDFSDRDRCAVVVSIVSLVLCLCGTFVTILPTRCATAAIERILVVALAVFWVLAMAASIVGPIHGQEGLSPEFSLDYPPIYFSSWATTICSIMSFAALYKENVYHGMSRTATQWCLMTSISLFVALSSIEFGEYMVDTTDPATNVTSTVPICTTESYSCERVEFAIVLGALTCPISFTTFVWKNSPLGCETDVALLLFIGWCCGAAYLTFDTGPGTEIGNIFFGTWTNLFLCLRILVVTLSVDAPSMKATFTAHQTQSVVDPGEIFDMAHDRLAEIPGFVGRDSSLDARAVSASLFEPVESWSFADDLIAVLPAAAEGEPDSPSDSPDNVEPTVQRRNHLEMWVIILIGSCVCLAALLPALPKSNERNNGQKFETFIISVSILNATIGFLLGLGLFRFEAGSVSVLLVRVMDRSDTEVCLASLHSCNFPVDCRFHHCLVGWTSSDRKRQHLNCRLSSEWK